MKITIHNFFIFVNFHIYKILCINNKIISQEHKIRNESNSHLPDRKQRIYLKRIITSSLYAVWFLYVFIDGCYFHSSALIINLYIQENVHIVLTILKRLIFVNNSVDERLRLRLALTPGFAP